MPTDPKEIIALANSSAAAATTQPNPPPATVPNQESSPGPSSVSSSTTTAQTPQPRTGGSIQLGMADRLAARLPPALQGFVRGAAERTVEPAMGVINALSQGQPSAAAGPAMQLGQLTNVPGIAAAGMGTALQGISEAAGMSQNSSKLLASLSELAVAGGTVLQGKMAMRGARGILTEAKGLGQAEGGMLAKENLSEAVRGEARTVLTAAKTRWQDALNKAEVEIASRGAITPNTPTWHKLQETVNDFGDVMGAQSRNTPAGRIVDALNVGTDVSPYDVIQVRRDLAKQQQFGKDLQSSDAAVKQKMIGAVRTKLADVLEGAAPDTKTAADYAAARSGYGNEYARPWRNLKTVLDPNTSPTKAFDLVFNPDDLHTFRAMHGAIGANPTMAGKLRMGLVESLGDASNGFQDANSALKKLRDIRPALQTTGLYTSDELNSLDAVLRQKRIPTIMDGLRYAASSVPRAGTIGGGSIGLSYLLASHPTAALAATVAAGALPHVIRASIMPAGSPAMRNTAITIASQVSRLARTLKMGEGAASPIESGDSDE